MVLTRTFFALVIIAILAFAAGSLAEYGVSKSTMKVTTTTTITTYLRGGNPCDMNALFEPPLNTSISQYNLQVFLLGPPETRANFSQVLISLKLTAHDLNSTFISIATSTQFRNVVNGHAWALQDWGPEVVGYTPPFNLTLTGTYYAIPSNYVPVGVFFVLGIWNTTGNLPYGTAYVSYSPSNQTVSIHVSNLGPYGCVTM